MAGSSQKRVVIVGAGIIGISIAYYLQRSGQQTLDSVIVLESEPEAACGASGKAGGFLARNWCDEYGCYLNPW